MDNRNGSQVVTGDLFASPPGVAGWEGTRRRQRSYQPILLSSASLPIVFSRVRGFFTHFNLLRRSNRIKNYDRKILLLSAARLRTRVLYLSRSRRTWQVRHFLGTIFSLRNRSLLGLGATNRSVRSAKGLTRPHGVFFESVDSVNLPRRKRRIVLAGEGRVSVLCGRRLLMILFLRRNTAGRNYQVFVVSFNRRLRNFNCAFKHFRRAFTICVFAGRVSGAFVVTNRLFTNRRDLLICFFARFGSVKF